MSRLAIATLFISALVGCAAINTSKDLYDGKKGLIVWAVDTDPPRFNGFAGLMSVGPQTEYTFLPGIARFEKQPAVVTEDDFITEQIQGDASRDTGAWFYAYVDEGDYAFAAIAEYARFRGIGWVARRLTPFATRQKTKDELKLSADTPTFHVAAGEAVYIGTFVSTLEGGTGARTNVTEAITREYQILPADAVGALESIGVPLNLVRTVDIFAGKPQVLAAFSKRVVTRTD